MSGERFDQTRDPLPEIGCRASYRDFLLQEIVDTASVAGFDGAHHISLRSEVVAHSGVVALPGRFGNLTVGH
jgi:hypothetical protein